MQTLITPKIAFISIFSLWLVISLQLAFWQKTKAEEVTISGQALNRELEEQLPSPQTQADGLVNCHHWDIYRWVKWNCNQEGQAQDIPDLQERSRPDRMRELLQYYNKEELYETFFYGGKMFGIYPEVAICIAKADTTLWRHLKSKNNLGNVGNNDRGDTVSYDSEHKAIKAIYQVLNNQYLGKYQTLWELSRKHNKDGKVYATSPENWYNNVANCISVIRGETVNENFQIRF